MSGGVVTAAYIVAVILFIFSLAGRPRLKPHTGEPAVLPVWRSRWSPPSARDPANVGWILLAMVIGAVIGIRRHERRNDRNARTGGDPAQLWGSGGGAGRWQQ
ncbi:hypothetical protein ACNKHW_10005 [Shigella flexneri]